MFKHAGRWSVIVGCSFAACATKSKSTVARNDHGGSCGEAVVISAQSDFAGTAEEHKWLEAHYPGYKMVTQVLTECAGHPADVLTIKTADGSERMIAFDITSSYGK